MNREFFRSLLCHSAVMSERSPAPFGRFARRRRPLSKPMPSRLRMQGRERLRFCLPWSMSSRGYSQQDLEKILGGNVLRVMRQVEQVARAMQAAR